MSDPFRRINPRPERQHLPFEVGRRGGPLFTDRFWSWLIFGGVVVAIAILAGRNA